MGIVQLPIGRLSGSAERAAPIEFGADTRGDEAFCSVECSLGATGLRW